MMMCWLWLMSGRGRCRQYDSEGRTLSGPGAVGGDFAAMHIDDALDDGKPEPGRAFAGRRLCRQPLEAAEQASKVLRRKAGAFVGDADDCVFIVVGHQQSDFAADWAVLDG